MEGSRSTVICRVSGFDVTGQLRALCADVCRRLPELSHIDMSLVAVRYCQTRRAGRYGIQASLTPLRFAGGERVTIRRGHPWTVQKVFDAAGREMLYLLSFYIPRFLDLPLDEKLATICHELWHIGPDFDGDLRRHDGRCYAHGASERRFHASMHALADRWLAGDPPAELYDFLRYSFAELHARHGRLYGTRITTPKLVRASGGGSDGVME